MIGEVEGLGALVLILPILLVVQDGLLTIAVWIVLVSLGLWVRRKTYGM